MIFSSGFIETECTNWPYSVHGYSFAVFSVELDFIEGSRAFNSSEELRLWSVSGRGRFCNSGRSPLFLNSRIHFPDGVLSAWHTFPGLSTKQRLILASRFVDRVSFSEVTVLFISSGHFPMFHKLVINVARPATVNFVGSRYP